MQVSAEHLLVQARERIAVQDYYGAVHLLEAVLADGRSFADAHQLLGLAFAFLGRHEQALQEFDRALALNPRYLEAHLHRGIVLTELGRGDEAEAAFRAALAEGNGAGGGLSRADAARLANQHAALGEAYAAAGALPEAIEQYRRALDLGPRFHDLRYRLARLLLEAGRPLEAREELETMVAGHPDSRDAVALLGLAHYLAGDAAAARDLWRRGLGRWPQDPRLGAYLAMAERLTG
ncbi:MAG: tetratricopeptide repeat protein [Gemmatimonadales bacterium]